MAVFPSTLGHNLVNYAVRHMAAYRVSLALLVEPVVSIALAALLLSEIPPPLFYPGALLVFLGVGAALWGESSSEFRVPSSE
jgi:drug/metabolite transporter (DMT)-like permease